MKAPTLTMVLGAAALICLGCAGTPKAPQKDSQTIFKNFDLNRDGRISRNEFMSQIRDRKMGDKVFTEMDNNRDGYISAEEAAANPALMQTAAKLAEPPELR